MGDETYKVQIIDDEKNLRSSLAEFLALDGIQCGLAASGEEGLRMLEAEVFDAIALDLRMPGMDGLAVLSRIRESGPGLPVVMMSAHGEINDAVNAMKLGAADYLVKPFDPAELAVRLVKAISDSRLIRMAQIGLRLSEDEGGQWLGEDPAMKEIRSLVRRVAPVMATVLITGESGTGKEVIAREIHRLGPRVDGPFIPVNVGSIPENLLESELFGYEKGAFTGAENRKLGLFELATGGTLFLDEIGDMPLQMQVKLLRVLQDRVIMRVGGIHPIPIDVRIISATNKNLERAVQEDHFREDLYFRLNVIRIRLPALRDRRLDIAPLAGLFLSRFTREMGKPITGISGDALRFLESYPFPGNIRELENSVERAVILCDSDTLQTSDFAFDVQFRAIKATENESEIASASKADAPTGTLSDHGDGLSAAPLSVREVERRAVIASLARNGGHRQRTATELGISRRTLLNKIREYGLS